MSVHRIKHDMSLNVGSLFGGSKGACKIFVGESHFGNELLLDIFV